MITFENVKFDAQGTNKKDKVFALTLAGDEAIEIKNCAFVNLGYSSILNNSTADVTISDCTFDCSNVYNPIEGSQSVNNGNVTVENCEFKGVPGNNFINFYQFKNGSKHEIRRCSFEPEVGNNIVRISNRLSANADFNVVDCEYNYAAGEPTEYTAFLICQDYTNKNGVKQDFTGCTISFENVKCDGVELDAEGRVFYVYEDGKGIITGTDNDPVIKFN